MNNNNNNKIMWYDEEIIICKEKIRDIKEEINSYDNNIINDDIIDIIYDLESEIYNIIDDIHYYLEKKEENENIIIDYYNFTKDLY